MLSPPNVLFAGGGSLGLIYPGLTIADRLAERIPGLRATIAGDGRAIERHAVRGAGWNYAHVPSDDLTAVTVASPLRLARRVAGWGAAHWLIRELDIDLVVSLGGGAAAPITTAARQSAVPFVLFEPDCLPATGTWRHAPAAHAICLAFEETRSRLPLGTAPLLTGGVGRPCFDRLTRNAQETVAAQPTAAQAPVARSADAPTLVVLGGAAGASSLNQSVPEALKRLGAVVHGWRIVHQTGAGALYQTEQRYAAAGIPAVTVTYIDELADLATHATLAICRPGGSTLAELTLAGLPAVLVPDSRRRDDLHGANARSAAVQYGCPIVYERTESLPTALAESLAPLMTEPATAQAIAERMRRHARPEAAGLIADVCCAALGLEATPAPREASLVRAA